jgi:pyridoxal phosphate enzyme (YggS family)
MSYSEHIKKAWSEINANIDQACEKANRHREDVKILAVSKVHPLQAILEAMELNINVFGENYVQELKEKHDELVQRNLKVPEFHFIGHLQTNKVKYIAPFVSMIHSVDSIKLAEEISKQAEKNNRTIDCLLQINSSGEDSKSGCEPEDALELTETFLNIPNIKLRGFMTIGSFSEDPDVSFKEFSLIKKISEVAKAKFPDANIDQISMGMTHDYALAVEIGATMVRIGSAIFGARNYNK